jgi:hypothetical protein
MRYYYYTFTFKGGIIHVRAFGDEQAKILAQAEAIKKGWDYTVLFYSKR